MSSNPYVPTPQEMREYVVSGGEYRPWAPPGDGTETARGAAFDRFIAKVRADTLREFAAKDIPAAVEARRTLLAEADRIEQEARDGR
ncbi:hypothetical protein ACP6NG_09000 [Brevibacterium casei]|uniref:hypothetical protein n=1 Tax=Brevibacterium casei TaxID=33889 RepID=UPI003F7D55F2